MWVAVIFILLADAGCCWCCFCELSSVYYLHWSTLCVALRMADCKLK